MRLVTIPKDRLKAYVKDSEMLQKADRPCALIIHLKYKGHRYDFAVPLRSNIAPSTPKDQYYPLPPRSSTKDRHRHGVHYAKMFPIDRKIVNKYHTENNIYASMIKAILDRDEKTIIAGAQAYLQRYEAGIIPDVATDIDIVSLNKIASFVCIV